jgi:hypothetical protein
MFRWKPYGDQENDQRCSVLLRDLTSILPSGKGYDTDEITLLRSHLAEEAALHGMLALSWEDVSITGRTP